MDASKNLVCLQNIKDAFDKSATRQYGIGRRKNLLIYFRDRELELVVIQAPTWAEMRALPGVTNVIPSSPVFVR